MIHDLGGRSSEQPVGQQAQHEEPAGHQKRQQLPQTGRRRDRDRGEDQDGDEEHACRDPELTVELGSDRLGDPFPSEDQTEDVDQCGHRNQRDQGGRAEGPSALSLSARASAASSPSALSSF